MLKGWEGLSDNCTQGPTSLPQAPPCFLDPTHPAPTQGTTVTQTGGPSA